MTTVATEDPQVRELHGGWVVVDGISGKLLEGPFCGPDGYQQALHALGTLEGKSLAEMLLDEFREGINR